MTILPFLHFFSALVYLYLAVYGLIRNPKALVNRIFAFILLSFALWGACLMFLHNPLVSKNTAALAAKICSITWIGFSSFLVLFSIAFTGKTHYLKKFWFYPLFFGVPLVFIYIQWHNGILADFFRVSYGWKPIFAATIWPHLFYTYYMLYMGIGLYLYVDFIKKTNDPIKKKQARIMLISIAITLILGSITDVLLPLLNIHSIPNLAASITLIWSFGVTYAMAKYKFLKITPTTAAENILATMFDGLILTNQEGYILMVNEATTKMLGYKATELKGKPLPMLLKDEKDPDTLINRLMHLEINKSPEFTFLTKDELEIPVLLSCSTLVGENKEPVGLVCVARDISERKEYEEERLKHHKLESLGILAGGIAHDFNNLLAVIIGNIELAKETIPSGKAKRQLENASQVAEVAAELTGKFITFSMGGWVKKEKIPVAEFLKECRLPGSTFSNTAIAPDELARFNFSTSYATDVRGIFGDEAQLRQVLQSVLMNAMEAIPPYQKGKIWVHAENTPPDEKNKLPITPKDDDYVKITVCDNGTGIPSEYLEKIFDPYFSTKSMSTQKGIGLGLTICMSIIKKHGGHIMVNSEEGKGTTVILYLPAFPEN